ncbi:MAG: SGNH/GDSL hydrolase family protein [Balneolales bacterium]|nr:SGNH/GDSL hydrolase family protein [Balneolales bacterium]
MSNKESKENTDHSDPEKKALKEYLVPFLNLEKQFPLLPGIRSIDNTAAFIGLSPSELIDQRTTLDENAQQAAEDLLTDEDVVQWISRLPFRSGELLVVVGDSQSEDLQGWFEIFRHVMEIGRPDLELEFFNGAVDGDTTVDILRRMNRFVVDKKADWVFVAAGASDAFRLGVAQDRCLVALTDFWENMNTIEQIIKDTTSKPPIWITPTPVLTEEMLKFELFEGVIQNQDLNQYREVISGRTGFIIDPKGIRFGKKPEPWFFLSDGFNASIAGHMETVKALLKALYGRKVVHSSRLDQAEAIDILYNDYDNDI